jgi:hypothetical protein
MENEIDLFQLEPSARQATLLASSRFPQFTVEASLYFGSQPYSWADSAHSY